MPRSRLEGMRLLRTQHGSRDRDLHGSQVRDARELALPADARADVILCTEVLEHVPDPIRAFEKFSKLVNSGGYLIITVPFSSLMHQAPYWFQAGLSPFWFEYWAKEFNIEVVELTVYGDYIDQMSQEMTRLFPFLRHFPGATKATSWLLEKYRNRLSKEVLSSGGYGVLFVGKRIWGV